MMNQEGEPKTNQEASNFRSNVLLALGNYDISPVAPEEIPGIKYAPDYFEFMHQCCSGLAPHES